LRGWGIFERNYRRVSFRRKSELFHILGDLRKADSASGETHAVIRGMKSDSE
jgi:hypothetical protein